MGAARNRGEALDCVARHSPDIVVFDMASGESLDLVRTLKAMAPELKAVAFGVEGDEREIIAFAQAGVAGYVPSDASMDALASTIAGVIRGDMVCPPLVAATLFCAISAGPPDGVQLPPPDGSIWTSRGVRGL